MTEDGPLSLQCLCERDSCEMEVRVVIGDSERQHEQQLLCQRCNRLFEFPSIEWQSESGRLLEGVGQARKGNQAGKESLLQWQRLWQLLEKARTGDREAAWFACEFLEKRAKRAIMMRLWRLGVPQHELEAAYHDVLIRIVERVYQLNGVLHFGGWLWTIEREIAANYRPPLVQPSKSGEIQRKSRELPKVIARRLITVGGHCHEVKVFEPCNPPEQPPRRQLRFVEPTDLNLYRRSICNHPDYVPSMYVDKLLSQLSPELREVARLRFVEDLTWKGVATRLGCPVWKARKLISELLCTLRKLCGVQVVQIAPGYELRYLPRFLKEPDADVWLSRLLAEVPLEPERIRLYGKEFVLKRQTAQYGKNYDYNPAAQKPHVWSPLLTELRGLVQQALKMHFESALCNLYPDGEAYVGWHRDAGKPKMIASVSLGALREIRFAGTGSNRRPYCMKLAHGSLLLIPESVNEHFKHMVPKSKQVTQPRVNVTFRKFQPASAGNPSRNSL